MTHDLHKLLDWKLLPGSHQFPGPDGGTCVAEAAVVVAGLPYRAIARPEHAPPSFSRALTKFALTINDSCPDAVRQRLIPFVPRLADSADPAAEDSRVQILDWWWLTQSGAIVSIFNVGEQFWDYAFQELERAFNLGKQGTLDIEAATHRVTAEKYRARMRPFLEQLAEEVRPLIPTA
jgi:hypothetical protein